MPFFLVVHALAVQAFADGSQGFQAWLTEATEAERLKIVRWGTVDLDQDGDVDASMAWLCDSSVENSDEIRPWRVIEADGQRWVFDRSNMRCGWDSGDGRPEFGALDPDTVTFTRYSRYPTVYLTASEGRLEVARYEQGSGGWTPHSLTQDWRRRELRRTWTDTELVWHANEAALIVVGSDSTEQPTLNRVLSGAEAYDGPADASLTVVAVERGPGQIDVVIRVTDDVPTERDRLELFSCRQDDDCVREPERIRQLTLTWTANGAPVVSSPTGASGPAVSRGDSTLSWAGRLFRFDPRSVRVVTATFGHEELGVLDAHHWSTPFTVLFVDSDAAPEPPTHIATSDLQLGEPRSFGILARHPDLRPFSPLTASMVEALNIVAVRRLEPGQPLRAAE